MEKFTLKDFITYNNPCFSCGGNITLKFGASIKKRHSHIFLRPTVDKDKTELTLLENYSNTLKLQIWHNSNAVVTSNNQRLKNYLATHELFYHSKCDVCHTAIVSKIIEFNLNKMFVRPVALTSEDLRVTEGETFYQVASNYESKKSYAYIVKAGSDTIDIKLPLYTLAKFKNKENFLKKLKTYVLFS